MKDRLAALGVALVFLLCFGGVGAGAAWVIGATLRDAQRAEDWVRVKADVQRASRGDVSYTYAWEGKTYAGSRLGTFVLGGTSGIDDWEQRVDDRIRAATEAGKPLTVWVDPAHPSDSMVDREVRWRLLAMFVPFALGFGGVGLFVGGTMLWKALGLPAVETAPATRQFLSTAGFALLWNGIIWPIAIAGGEGLWEEGEWFPLAIIGLFCLIGALVAWSAVVLFFKALVAGHPFQLDPGLRRGDGRERVSRSGKVLS